MAMARALSTRRVVLLTGLAAGFAPAFAAAQSAARKKIKAVATFSILGDFVRNVGGDRVDVATLVGPNGDVHVFSPTPTDAKMLAVADIVFVNGLGLEGWMTRLVQASGSKAPTIVATKDITPRRMVDANDAARRKIDPHAWQSVANAKIYVANIRDGLDAVDPAGTATYDANAAAYLAKLDDLDAEVRAAHRPDSAGAAEGHHHPRRLRLFRRRLRHRLHRAGGGIDRGRALGAGHGGHHRADPPAKHPGGVPGEHHQSAADGSDRPRDRRQDRRHALFRRAVRRPAGRRPPIST